MSDDKNAFTYDETPDDLGRVVGDMGTVEMIARLRDKERNPPDLVWRNAIADRLEALSLRANRSDEVVAWFHVPSGAVIDPRDKDALCARFTKELGRDVSVDFEPLCRPSPVVRAREVALETAAKP